MTDYNKQIEDFKQFAADKVKTHQNELHTRYENEKIDRNTLQTAYEEHRKILLQELEDETKKLLSGNENPWLQEELNKISKTFLQQLSTNHL